MNNPLLGAIILAAIFVFDVEVGAGCVLGGVTATLTDLTLGLHPLPDLNAGVPSFNGVLVGTVIPILFPAKYHGVGRSPTLWASVFVGAIARFVMTLDTTFDINRFSVFLARAFGNFLSKFKVPYMALPFNLIAVFVFLTLQPHTYFLHKTQTHDPRVRWGEEAEEFPVNSVLHGIAVSMGQVYAIHTLKPSIIINLAVILSSPLLFVMSTIGASVGTLVSLVFLDSSEYDQIYDGIWGYNGLLSMAAVSCVFFPFTPASFIAGLVNTVLSVFIQRALANNMNMVSSLLNHTIVINDKLFSLQNYLPVFTLPMTLVTLVMLLVSSERQSRWCGVGGQLVRCEDMSYPEKQCWSNILASRDNKTHENGTAEEKQPTIAQEEDMELKEREPSVTLDLEQ